MKRCKIAALFDRFHNFIRNNNGRSKFLTAMDNAMTYGMNLRKGFYNAVCLVCQTAKNKLDSVCVIRHRRFDGDFVLSCGCIYDSAAINSDTFAQSLCKYVLGVRLN